jgi:DegV family protein with EDD domain
MKEDGHFCNVPLELEVDGYRIVDDETFDQADFLLRVRESAHSPKSSCPSPESYLKEYEGPEEHVYVVTLSDKLSGSYNSAVLATKLYHEEHGDDGKKIYVFNSRSASIGETLIGIRAQELEEAGVAFEELVLQVEDYIASQNTFFVLETLETFRKSGRISHLKALAANTLNIKPVMGSNDDGSIRMVAQGRGMKRALSKMVDSMLSVTKNCEDRILAISHCNCPQRAEFVRELVEKAVKFKEVIIVDTAGVSSMYANDGGVIIVA